MIDISSIRTATKYSSPVRLPGQLTGVDIISNRIRSEGLTTPTGFVKSAFRFINLVSFFAAAALLVSASSDSYGFTGDKTVATVNNDVITLSDYYLFAKGLGIQGKPGVVDEGVLKRMMEEKVILYEAKRTGIEVSDAEIDRMIEDVKKDNAVSQEAMERELKKDELDMSDYRKLLKDRLTVVRLIETEVDSKVIVTDKEVEDYYRANQGDYTNSPERAALKAIFLRLNEDATVTEITDLKRKALKISAQLEQGESFDALVNQYDDDSLKSQGGRWGEVEKGALIPPLDEKVFSMKTGEISEPVWVRDGVYILKLEDRTVGTVKPLDEVRAKIGRHLKEQRKARLFNEWMKTLWEKASIKVN